MKREERISLWFTAAVSMLAVLGGCSGSGAGGDATSGSAGGGTTVISGKVTLSSSVVSGKPSIQERMSVPSGKPGSRSYALSVRRMPAAGLQSSLRGTASAPTPLTNATVELYDADHPEWLYPVATGSTDSSGEYTLSTMTNASKNAGATYADGDDIPVGNYTIVAFKWEFGQKPVVAVQTIVTQFEGNVPNVNFEVLPSDIAPAVISILGAPKNRDGSQTWGGAGTKHAANAAIQVVFSMPMVREYLRAIKIASTDGGTVPTGRWSLSADWLTTTYYFDAGQTLTAGKNYAITIYGADDTVNSKVVNVYGNPIERTAQASFTASAADTIGPTVQWNSPTVIEMGSLVDVTQSFRVEANEILDVNHIRLTGVPSIGAKPGVIYLGRNSRGLYVYEFILGEPLRLDTGYSLTVQGGRDLAGHRMNVLTGTIRTFDAANTPGIDPAANAETQNLQAQVKSLFGKWVRAMNDRSLAKFQALMSPDFYMEYDASRGVDSRSDINRDGRYSFAEFSRMIAGEAFPQWDYCGTTIVGTIAPAPGTYINIQPLTNSANFEFRLAATNTVNTRECSDAAPRESFYTTVKHLNGMWKMVRASVGIDTREKALASQQLITSSLWQRAGSDFFPSETPIADGAKFDGVPNTTVVTTPKNIRAKFTWQPVQGVQAYVLVVADAREPWSGFAVAFPSTVTSALSNENWISGLGGYDVSQKFGLYMSQGGAEGMNYVEGGRYYWEVIGLATTQPDKVANQPLSVLLNDITHASTVKYFGITGVFPELKVMVRPGTNPNAAAVAFAETLWGYDVGSAYQASLMVESPYPGSSGWLWMSGSQSSDQQVTFTPDASGFYGVYQQTLTLYKGHNYVSICDNGDWSAVPPRPSLCRYFTIYTRGGRAPVIGVWEVIDDLGNTIAGDTNNYFVTTAGSKKAVVKGGVSDSGISQINLNLQNGTVGAYSNFTAPVTCDGAVPPNCTFEFQTDIYKGNNWINLSGGGAGGYYNTSMGIHTDTGSVWVPPIAISKITGATSAVKRAEYPGGSDWDVDPGFDYYVNINGKFKTFPAMGYGTYNIWTEAGSSSYGEISPAGDGSFMFSVILYKGWNNIWISDNSGNGYSLNIYAANGKLLIKPKITRVEGVAYTSGPVTITDCEVTIDGTAMTGDIRISENSYTGAQYRYDDYYSAQSKGSGTTGNFSTTIRVVGPSGYNYIDIYDREYNWVGLTVYTTASCAWVAPNMAVETVKKGSDGTTITPVGGVYNAGASSTVTVGGWTTHKERTITASLYVCGGREVYDIPASAVVTSGTNSYSWSISGIKVYQDMSANNIWLSDGYSSRNVQVTAANSQTAPLSPFRITSVASAPGGWADETYRSCNYMAYNVETDASVTVSGVTNAPDGKGLYLDAVGTVREFTISGGVFTISGIAVYNEYNYLSFVDTMGRYFDLQVYTSNGVPRPQFVTITFPVSNATVTGVKTVTGTVTDPTGGGWSPGTLYGYVYQNGVGFTSFSSNPTAGEQAMTFDGANFSFSYDFGANTSNSTSIEVYGCEYDAGFCHGHYLYVNSSSSSGYYKPGAISRQKPFEEQMHRLEMMRRQQIRSQGR